MTDKEKLDKLVAEIEKVKVIIQSNRAQGAFSEGYLIGQESVLEHFENFVKSMQEEPVSVSEDIDKEANECWDYVFSALGWDENSLITMNHKEFLAFACHFANWQKEQMTKTAIDGKIYETQARSKLKAATIGKISGLKYRVGDKVKLIILKED